VGERSSSVSQLPTEHGNTSTTAESRPQKRRFARADVSIPVQYMLAGSAEKQQGEIINLGGGGVRVASVEDITRGETVTLHFLLPGMKHEVIARGKVVLSFYEASSSRYAHGVAFAQIAVDDQKQIVEYVESIQHENADI